MQIIRDHVGLNGEAAIALRPGYQLLATRREHVEPTAGVLAFLDRISSAPKPVAPRPSATPPAECWTCSIDPASSHAIVDGHIRDAGSCVSRTFRLAAARI